MRLARPTTWSPAATSRRAQAAPIPELAPLTTATRFCHRSIAAKSRRSTEGPLRRIGLYVRRVGLISEPSPFYLSLLSTGKSRGPVSRNLKGK